MNPFSVGEIADALHRLHREPELRRDLSQRQEVKFLQGRWEANRWGRGYPRPYFKFSLEIQELPSG